MSQDVILEPKPSFCTKDVPYKIREHSLTVRVLIHGWHARILARVFVARSEDRAGVAGFTRVVPGKGGREIQI